MSSTHLGNVLRDVLYDKRISVRKLSSLLDVSTNTIYNLFQKEIFHPKWLKQLSDTLEHDFHQYSYKQDEGRIDYSGV